MSRQKTTVLLALLFVSQLAMGQQIQQFIDDEYVREDVFGINKGTNGGIISGIYYRHSKMLNKGNLMNYGVEIVNIRHPRETRVTTPLGSTFVFGKSNYLLSIRPTYGREKILFKKAPQQGARITAMAAAGPAFGLEVPYYIRLANSSSAPYNPDIHRFQSIQGSSSLFRGLTESTFVLGAHAKTSLTFETNSTKKRVFGIEIGFSIDAFTREINILPLAANRSVYTAAFAAIYFGRRR